MKEVFIILAFLSMMVFFVGVTMMIGEGLKMEENFEPHKVKCYDVYSNEILGQTCWEESRGEGDALVFLGVFVMVCGIILGSLLIAESFECAKREVRI